MLRCWLQPSPPPINQVLSDAASKLKVVEAIQSVKPNWPPLDSEEVIEGSISEAPTNQDCKMPNAAAPVAFEDANGEDEAGALREACRSLDKLNWDENDLKFVFNKIETRMGIAGVQKQYTKFQVLAEVLPKRVEDEVKPLLCLTETEFPQNDAYKQLKSEILRIFGPRPEAGMERALGRVLTEKPSQLARALVNDMCKLQLNGQCCPFRQILSAWPIMKGVVPHGI